MQYSIALLPMCLVSMKNFLDTTYIKNADLKNFCTFKIGGKAKHLFIVQSNDALLNVCYYCNSHNIRYKIIGLGANLLFDDKGYNGAIIINQSKNFMFKKNYLYCDAGVNISTLISESIKRNLSGLEYFSLIPSTIGGAVVNSLGAFDHQFFDLIERVICYKKSDPKKRVILSKNDCKFGYRTSIFKADEFIITRVKLKLKFDDKSEILKRMKHCLNKKSSTQPIKDFSAGSVFKRSTLIPAKVIDELGLKGKQIGGAEISKKHSGFIINRENATAIDVLNLIKYINDIVYKKFNQKFELEIEFVPFN